jgi:hypothetical protein
MWEAVSGRFAARLRGMTIFFFGYPRLTAILPMEFSPQPLCLLQRILSVL